MDFLFTIDTYLDITEKRKRGEARRFQSMLKADLHKDIEFSPWRGPPILLTWGSSSEAKGFGCINICVAG